MRTEKIEIRVSPEEKKLIQDLANQNGFTLSAFMKSAVIDWIYGKYSPEETKELIKTFKF